MLPSQRIVSLIPLTEILTKRGNLPHRRGPALGEKEIRGLLKEGHVQFVVADVGESLRWILLENCFEFFKQEIQPHLAELDQCAYLEDSPGNYFYFASQWLCPENEPAVVILLEKHH